MNIQRFLPALLATLLAAPAWAQSTDKPLNLKLPPSDVPAASSSAAATTKPAPGMYYGDTSGRMGSNDTAAATTATDCDDYSYNQPRMHGSVGMGVMSGRHMSGNYQTGTVNLSQAFGSCDQPRGGVSISVGAGNGHFNGRRGR